ncbi:helix-turn-helix transcriptional regulator [Kitasatospora sp. NPDC002227]|uniref:helix-turn-helix domain-containing protein n=1 Tax=Kitasatospora sp. NPDC002227 TaxID=3154773 RepID=UPI0033343CE5
MAEHLDLGEFLQARRALVSPESAGLRGGARRRVPGLRREELAQLAGISVEYYQRLEQGRARHPSGEVLDAIGDALRLDTVQRDHLHRLVRRRGAGAPPLSTPTPTPPPLLAPLPLPPSPPMSSPPFALRPELARLLERITVPALVLADDFDVLALNPVARHLFVPPTEPDGGWNLARYLFLTPESREFYVDWPGLAETTAGQLRATAGRYPADQRLTGLIAELRALSHEFAVLWARADVTVRTHGSKSLRHPAVGTLTFTFETFELGGDARQRLITLTPAPDGPTEAALDLLAGWAGARRPD